MKTKRFLALLLALCLGLAGCGEEQTQSVQNQSPEPAVEEAASEETPDMEEASQVDEEISAVEEAVSSMEEQIQAGVSEEALQQAVASYDVDFAALTFDNTAWQYDEENRVYYQYGVAYCAEPETLDYETLGIYVPGDYLDAVDNGDGTYTCTLNTTAEVGNFTAENAPMVMPVNTAGYSAQASPTGYYYSGIGEYLDAGFIYVYAGCRGRNNGYNQDGSLAYKGGAPWGVVDLKAAVRFLRFNQDLIPGDTDRIFSFGHSGGGAQSAVLGASGDSTLYFDYLASIGAAMYDADGNYISDAICGAMCWCPITSLDYADEAYEWNMGQYMDTGTRASDTWTSALSQDLAAAYGEYINDLGLQDGEGNPLTLTETETGVYAAGSYYDYMVSEIERSLNNFLADTEFPYTSGGSFMADGGFGGGGPSMEPPAGGLPGPMGNETTEAETYETPEDYIASLNADGQWVEYDAETNTATITSVEAFAQHVKNATKSVGAFDDLARGQAENYVFGDAANDALHFDVAMAELLEENQEKYSAYADWDPAYVEAYQEYLESVDAMGNDSVTRQNMYNPMYYLTDYYEGCGSSNVAEHWRIHSGITQGDTALTVEMNLALALESCEGVSDVDFEMVWGQGHTMAERTGDAATNFIAWVCTCCGIA